MKKLILFLISSLVIGGSAFGQRTASNPLGGNLSVQDAGTCSTAGSFLWQTLPNNAGTTTVNLAGTFSGTLTIRLSNNGGGSWTTSTTTSSVGTSSISTNGFTDICADVTTFTSGVFQVTITTGLQQVQSVVAGSGSGGGVGGSYTLALAGFNGGCGSNTLCTAINGDGHYVLDATSNSTTTITCPNSDCNFTGTDSFGRPMMKVGQKIWATTQGGGLGVSFLTNTTYVCPVTTVASFTAQSVVLNLACTANGTANVVLIWGDDDGPTLHNISANSVGCANIVTPDNTFILFSRGFFNTKPPCWNPSGLTGGIGYPATALSSPQSGGALFVMTPDMVWADCGPICIGQGLATLIDFSIWGTGLNSATNANCANAANKVVVSPGGSYMFGVNVAGVCPGEAGLVGVRMSNFDLNWFLGGVQEVGTIACQTSAGVALTYALDCRNDAVSGAFGLQVQASASQTDLSSFPLVGIDVAGNLTTRGAHIFAGSGVCGIQIDSGGFWYSVSDFVGVDGGGTTTETCPVPGGTVQSTNTTYTAGGASGIAIQNQGTFIDLGGNRVTGGSLVKGTATGSVFGVFRGVQTVSGTGQGTGTASSTLGLYGAGQFATPNLTSTVVNLGQVMANSGTLIGLTVSAGTAGVNASSGAVTVLKNGSATALTCTIGTSSPPGCVDSTHTAAYAQGDVISFQVTTQAADTLANVKAAVLTW